VKAREVKTSPLSDLSKNGAVTRPSVPNRAINAYSSADIAVVAFIGVSKTILSLFIKLSNQTIDVASDTAKNG